MSFELILPFFPEPLQELILDSTIADLSINGTAGVFVERDGVMGRAEGVSIGEEQLAEVIQQIARVLGKDITEQDPILDTRLPNGSRVAALYKPCSPSGVTVTIRKFNRWFTTGELTAMGTLPESVRDSVLAAILNRRNVLISGGTGSGKSTMPNAFVAHIPPRDRPVVIEKLMELGITNPNGCVGKQSIHSPAGRKSPLPNESLPLSDTAPTGSLWARSAIILPTTCSKP